MDIYCDLCRYVIHDSTMIHNITMMHDAWRVYHISCYTDLMSKNISTGMKFQSIGHCEAEELYRAGKLLQSAGTVVIQPDGSIVRVG